MKNFQDINLECIKDMALPSIGKLSEQKGPQKFIADLLLESGSFWKTDSTLHLGHRGENLIREVLLSHGFQIHKSNWRTPFGEVDLVVTHVGFMLIAEIKTRKTFEAGDVERVLSFRQKMRLKRAATWIWLKNKKQYSKFRCGLFIVTSRGIIWHNLPLLYDQA